MDMKLPNWYDELFEFECESKGSVLNFEVVVENKKKVFNFYDISRFIQDANDDICQQGYFKDDIAVIIESVTRKNIIKFLETLSWD